MYLCSELQWDAGESLVALTEDGHVQPLHATARDSWGMLLFYTALEADMYATVIRLTRQWFLLRRQRCEKGVSTL
jgi:hypothetical protein